MIPSGWERKKIADVATFQRGFDLPSSVRVGGKFPIVSSGGISGWHNQPKAKGPGVVTGRYGSVGTVFFIEKDYWPLNTSLWVKNFHGNDPKYIYFLTCTLDFKKLSDKTGVPGINRNDLHRMEVLIPPLSEQEKITREIDVWNRAIDLTECLIAAKQERRKWLMQQLLTGKRRLTGFSKSWRTVTLGNVFTNRVDTNCTDLPLVAITGENGVVRRDGLIRRDTSSEDKSRYLKICPGDIGYNTMRMWQGVCGFSGLEGIVSPAYTVVTPGDDVDGEFIALLFKSQPVVHLFHRHSQGMVNDTLNLKFRNFAKIRVTIPDREEQRAIASVFRLIDRELELLKKQAVALQEQKRGLMQQLLTGKKRVKIEA